MVQPQICNFANLNPHSVQNRTIDDGHSFASLGSQSNPQGQQSYLSKLDSLRGWYHTPLEQWTPTLLGGFVCHMNCGVARSKFRGCSSFSLSLNQLVKFSCEFVGVSLIICLHLHSQCDKGCEAETNVHGTLHQVSREPGWQDSSPTWWLWSP